MEFWRKTSNGKVKFNSKDAAINFTKYIKDALEQNKKVWLPFNLHPDLIDYIQEYEVEWRLLVRVLEGIKKAGKYAMSKKEQVRLEAIEANGQKGKWADYFTEVDTRNETIIKETLRKEFSPELLQILGEEYGTTGDEDAEYEIDIDPIDGTNAYKHWFDGRSIMIWVGKGKKQFASFVYFPEKENQPLLYYIKDKGIFITYTDTWETKKITTIKNVEDKSNLLVKIRKHTTTEESSIFINPIENILRKNNFQIHNTKWPGEDALEAVEMWRAMIIDGDFHRVDFIPLPLLISLWYKIYDREGNEQDSNNPSALARRQLVIVPPWKAWRDVLDHITNICKK